MTLTEQQRTQIRQTVLADRSVPRVDRVDFSLSVGTRVPSRVRVIEVPQTLIEIHPEWRGHRFFVVRDEIVIVDRELAIVAVVPVGGSSTEIDRSGPRGGMAAGEGSSGPSVSLSVDTPDHGKLNTWPIIFAVRTRAFAARLIFGDDVIAGDGEM